MQIEKDSYQGFASAMPPEPQSRGASAAATAAIKPVIAFLSARLKRRALIRISLQTAPLQKTQTSPGCPYFGGSTGGVSAGGGVWPFCSVFSTSLPSYVIFDLDPKRR